ncbi:MAG: SMC family ATPase [Candidatus Caldarchaeum sp.]
MIERIEIRNFMSHRETSLELRRGLNVFIGRNGAGKSSVVDALLYCLYGRQSRGEVRNVVNNLYGGGGKVQVELFYNGSRYTVSRAFGKDGGLEHAEVTKDGKPVIVGERRKQGVAEYIANLFGLDYEKLKSCVVVQQGELDRIISMKPRELKNLFDDLIGIGSEAAYNNMKKIIEMFDERVRKELEFSVSDAGNLEERLKQLEEEQKRIAEELDKDTSLLQAITEREKKLEEKAQRLRSLFETRVRTETALRNLLNSAETWIKDMARDIVEAEENISVVEREAEFRKVEKELDEVLERKTVIDRDVEALRKRLKEEEKRLEALNKNAALSVQATGLEQVRNRAVEVGARIIDAAEKALEAAGRGLVEEAGRWTDVVKAESRSLPELVVEAHEVGRANGVGCMVQELRELIARLKEELEAKRRESTGVDERLEELKTFDGTTVDKFRERLGRAKLWLENRRISDKRMLEDLKRTCRDLSGLVEGMKTKKLHEIDVRGLEPLSRLGGREAEWFEFIRSNYDKAAAVDSGTVEELEKELNEVRRETGMLRGRIAEKQRNLENVRIQLKTLQEIRSKLVRAVKFYELLELVRREVYSRDGYVPRSLRSWAVKKVSQAVSRYVEIFNLLVDDIAVVEENGDVVVECFSHGREVSVDSLSGGERVGVALALRLAIGDVLGAERLGIFILDEPTVHLDPENRSRLSHLFTSLAQTINQVLVITHDEELFTGTDAHVYKFSRNTGEPTRVVELSQ